MKILIYSANFAPEPTGIGKYSGEMAQWLAAKGHEVRVVSAPPYYPAWRVANEYRGKWWSREQWEGVDVWRAPIWVPRSPGGVKRVLHLLSFGVSSIPTIFWQIFWHPDVVFTVAPAFVCTPAALIVTRLSGSRSWLHIQDFEVDVAFSMGLLKGKWSRKVVLWVERRWLRRFHVTSSISGRMVERLHEKGVWPERLRYFPNWADINHVAPLSRPSSYRKELGILDSDVVMLFSGTLGSKQGLEVIPQAALRLVHRKNIVFVICGDGVMKPQLEEQCKDLPNVRLLSLQPFERLGELLGLADVHLLPQSPQAEDLVLPSKLSGMLASGRPVIATCRPDTEIASVVKDCGVIVPPENAAALAEAIVSLADQPGERQRMGLCARQYAEENLAKDAVMTRWEHEATKLLRPRTPWKERSTNRK